MHRVVESGARVAMLAVLLIGGAASRASDEQPTAEEILNSKPNEEDYATQRRCVRSISIERTEILSDRLIVFHMKRGEEKLLLQFPQPCPGLRRDVQLLYEKGETSRICEHDTVQPRLDLGSASRWGARCILPAFESVSAQQIEYLKSELRHRPPAGTTAPKSSEATGLGS